MDGEMMDWWKINGRREGAGNSRKNRDENMRKNTIEERKEKTENEGRLNDKDKKNSNCWKRKKRKKDTK